MGLSYKCKEQLDRPNKPKAPDRADPLSQQQQQTNINPDTMIACTDNDTSPRIAGKRARSDGPTEAGTRKRSKTRLVKNAVKSHFKIDAEGLTRTCLYCPRQFSAATSSAHLKAHLASDHPTYASSNTPEAPSRRPFDAERANALAAMIAASRDEPTRVVVSLLEKFASCLRSDYVLPSQDDLFGATLSDPWASMRTSMRVRLTAIERLCLTVDVRAVSASSRFNVVVALSDHNADPASASGKRTLVINAGTMPTSAALASEFVLRTLRDWKIAHERIASIVHNNEDVAKCLSDTLSCVRVSCVYRLFGLDAVAAALCPTERAGFALGVIRSVARRCAFAVLDHTVSDHSLSESERQLAGQLGDALSPLAQGLEVVADPLMQGIGPAVATASKVLAALGRPQNDRAGAWPAEVLTARYRAAQVVSGYIDRALADDAICVAIYLDPRTKDFAFLADPVDRVAQIERAHALLAAAVAPTDDGFYVAKQSQDPKAAVAARGTSCADAALALFGVSSTYDAEKSGSISYSPEAEAYKAERALPMLSPEGNPADPWVWWRARRSRFAVIARFARTRSGMLNAHANIQRRPESQAQQVEQGQRLAFLLDANHYCRD